MTVPKQAKKSLKALPLPSGGNWKSLQSRFHNLLQRDPFLSAAFLSSLSSLPAPANQHAQAGHASSCPPTPTPMLCPPSLCPHPHSSLRNPSLIPSGRPFILALPLGETPPPVSLPPTAVQARVLALFHKGRKKPPVPYHPRAWRTESVIDRKSTAGLA